jgi:hypothetical protein
VPVMQFERVMSATIRALKCTHGTMRSTVVWDGGDGDPSEIGFRFLVDVADDIGHAIVARGLVHCDTSTAEREGRPVDEEVLAAAERVAVSMCMGAMASFEDGMRELGARRVAREAAESKRQAEEN